MHEDSSAPLDGEEIRRKYGAPFTVTKSNQILINQQYFVARFAAEHLVLHEAKEREFYLYESKSGLWVKRSIDAVKTMFADDFKRFIDKCGSSGIAYKSTNGLLESFASLLRGRVEKINVFKRNGRVIHLPNGMLHLGEKLELKPFSPEYYSRNACPIEWNPNSGHSLS